MVSVAYQLGNRGNTEIICFIIVNCQSKMILECLFCFNNFKENCKKKNDVCRSHSFTGIRRLLLPERALENSFSDIFISGTALQNRCEQSKVCLDTPPTLLCARIRDA